MSFISGRGYVIFQSMDKIFCVEISKLPFEIYDFIDLIKSQKLF